MRLEKFKLDGQLMVMSIWKLFAKKKIYPNKSFTKNMGRLL